MLKKISCFDPCISRVRFLDVNFGVKRSTYTRQNTVPYYRKLTMHVDKNQRFTKLTRIFRIIILLYYLDLCNNYGMRTLYFKICHRFKRLSCIKSCLSKKNKTNTTRLLLRDKQFCQEPYVRPRYIWFSLKRGTNVMGEVKSIKYKRSPLVQCGLEIPIEVTVDWDDERAKFYKRERKK